MKEDSNGSNQHKDLGTTEITRSESCVSACTSAFNPFLNLFRIEDKEGLYNISSGVRLPANIEKDLLDAEELGKNGKEIFIKERLEKNEKFFEPVKKLKLKTMASVTKPVKLKTSQNKVVELKQQGNIAFQLLVKSQQISSPINLHDVMRYQLTPIPYCLATPEGFLNKTNKALGLKIVADDMESGEQPPQAETLLIVDGNALFHSMTEIPDTLKGVCEKLFRMIPGTSDFIFSTDMYHKNSIKSTERIRRGCGDRLLVKGPAMRRPADWKGFLSNDENKEQFTDILVRVWSDDSFSENLKDRKVILIYFNF